jgi:IS5 family transposase
MVMAQRDFRQMSLVDQFYNIRPKRSEHLDALAKCIDWAAILKLLNSIYASTEGAASYPIPCYVRILLLQQWYGLSDREAELAIEDSLSFRRFTGIPLEEKVPDHTRIWAFRQKLAELGLDEKLLEEINRQIEAQGLFVKKGTLIDATIIKAAAKAPKGDDGALSDVDPEAGWTKKNGVSTYGDKGHIGVDEGTDLIRRATFTSADVHDSVEFKNLVSGGEEAAYADKGYPSEEHRAFLAEKGIKDGIMYKAARGKPLKDWQVWFNKTVAPIRAGVERIFARMKVRYGFTRARYFGLKRNACGFYLLCTAMNIARMASLHAA